MARDWIVVHLSILRSPKYRRLTPAGRGALLHVLVLAATTRPEATWPSRAALADYLEVDGFDPDVLDELVRHGWVEEANGCIVVHDWDQHQYAVNDAVRREYEAHRKRDWRKRKREREVEVEVEEEEVDRKSPELSGTSPGLHSLTSFKDGRWQPFLREWVRRIGRPPTGDEDEQGTQRAILWPMVENFPSKSVDWIRSAPRGLNSYDLVGYLKQRHQAAVREQREAG